MTDRSSWQGSRVQPTDPFPGIAPPQARARLKAEVAIVLALTVGQSALYAVLSLVRRVLDPRPLSQQSAQLNTPLDAAVLWDILYRVLDVGFDLMLVVLVVFLLWEPGRGALRRLGLDFTRFGVDLGRGLALVAVIGIPGIALYVAGRLAGVTVAVEASPGGLDWWTVPLLLLSALRAGLIEEVIVVGYLGDRLSRLGWGPWRIIVAASLLRGVYHAYQGFGAIAGNVAMGLVFGWCYRRWGRLMPLVVAHTAIDAIAFVGYPLAAAFLPDLF
ncbi:CPBP family intramembrane glutamic endopeptidase [Microbacterium sp. Root53]|uniref:CPBP family intramembrane glutamic endopeptidase n=1 Tax=Microbacterium sp. Root53 TaxID=1736553 RepID=UPI0009E6A8E5|nr:CPBP family intramembrane glutamic endopeptidase [Microbacterium sp. Root53]